jgi:hypothetical protein
MNRLAIAFSFLYFLSGKALAEMDCQAAPEEYRIVFGNGIMNTLPMAAASKEKLAKELGHDYAGQNIAYDLAYNYTDSFFLDLIQSIDQSAGQYRSDILQWLHGTGLVPDWYSELLRRLLFIEYQINAPELTTHIQKYREAILQGNKVLVVSHSQGNFYANQAKQILSSTQPSVPLDSFGIFAVATPATNVGGASGPYLTNHRDVINNIPGNLEANWTLRKTNDGLAADDLGGLAAHSFTETYLSSDFDIRPELIAGIKQQLAALQDPPQVVGSGPISATMTWNLDRNDVDLHIYEPDGSHIFYRNLYGTSGNLDYDNVDGFGPEHYFTDCNQLQVGEYIFGVNYFDDHDDQGNTLPTRQVNAVITITVPTSTRTFNVSLNSDMGAAGNNTPVLFAKVIVIRTISSNPNTNGKLKYIIVPL